MPTTRTVAALAIIAGTSLGRTPVTAVGSTADIACIELRRAGADLVAVPVQVVSESGRRATHPFLLDTGSEVTFVDEELAGALGLAATSRTTVDTPGGPAAAIASRVSLNYGGVRVDDLEVVRDALRSIRAIAPEIRGVLGQDVLRRTNWLLDYPEGVVLQDPHGVIGERVRGERLTVDWIGDLPTVGASFGRSTPVRLVLDSAATGLVLFRLPIGAATGESARLQTLARSMDAPILSADALHLGSLRVPHPRAAVVVQGADAADANEAGGLLPTSLFDAVYFDQKGSAAVVTAGKVQSGTCKVNTWR
jgi:Aspartyl protease